ncbi:MAG TPA: DEAD/DEAH box helicase [Terriglobales bacterium]|nr:DEAD/DEAH box helicase [Terriglobales bacterium]
MYEFNVPDELQDIQLGGSDPSTLFPLVIGNLGDEASRIADLELQEQTDRGRIIPGDTYAIRFSAAFLHAYVASKFANGSAAELLLLSAASYYLCDLAGSAAVVLREAQQSPPTDDWDRLLRWLLSAEWFQTPHFENRRFSSAQSSVATNLAAYFSDKNNRPNVVGACSRLRHGAYSFGSDRDLLYTDVCIGVAKKRLQNAARHVLPAYSQLPEASWSDALKKPEFMKELWPSQHIFGERGLLQGRSAVVQMPTSAGKTRAIELVLRSSFFSGRATLAVIVAPFRALCTEITAWLRKAFIGENVILNELSDALQVDYSALLAELIGPETGGRGVSAVEARQVIVVTPEKLLYVLRHSPELATTIGVVIYDEGHQFDTGERGITYELLLTSLKRLIPNDKQVILVSAVIGNAAAIGEWLIGPDVAVVDAHDLSMTDRAIAFASWRTELGQLQFVEPGNPDHFDYFVPRIIEEKHLKKKNNREKERAFPQHDPRSIALYLGLKVVSNGSVAIFCGTKATASGLAEMAADVFDRGLEMQSAAAVCNSKELKALGDLYEAHFGDNEARTLAARLGILSHHGNTPNGIRLSVEYAMKEGLVRFVVCTSTLAQGVNLPIRYLIVSGTMQGTERIKTRDFHNLLGRAGRAGMHTEGTIIFSDPELYDLRMDDKKGWRWKNATELIDPSNAGGTESSLLGLLAPFTNRSRTKYLKLDIIEFLKQIVDEPELAHRRLSEAGNKFKAEGFSQDELHSQMKHRRKLLEALESYLMANRGSQPFAEYLAATEELAKQTLAYHMADEGKKQELVRLFAMIAEYIENREPDAAIQATFGRTLLGVADSETIMAWTAENAQFLVGTNSTSALLELLWPLIKEVVSDELDRYLPESAVLPAVQSWVAGHSYAEIFSAWVSAGGSMRWGKKTRKTKMDDVVELCDNAIGYQSTLVIAAVAEHLGAVTIDGAADCVLNLGTLQKQVKYGISEIDEIALYEMGFADRIVARALRSVIAPARGRTVRGRLRLRADAARQTLQHFPGYFSVCLSSLLQ